MSEPTWLFRELIHHLHGQLIREHGGSYGIRDEGPIESALIWPRNRWEYEEQVDLPDLAAAYAYGLAQNHGFVDGNKRVAFAAAGVFLIANGLRLTASEGEAYAVVVDLASGELSEVDLAQWLRARVEPIVESEPTG
jgi:death-on-curing protein